MLGSSLWDLQGVQACLHLTATRSSPSSHSSSDQREEVSLAQGWQEPSLHAKIAGHRAGFCETALTPSYSLLHSQVVPLAQGTEPCRHLKPHVCTEKKLCECARHWQPWLCALRKGSEGPVMWAEDFSCNLCGKLIVVDYKPSATLSICNTEQQQLFKRAALHPAPQAQNSHVI